MSKQQGLHYNRLDLNIGRNWMKRKTLLFSFLLLVLVSACAPSRLPQNAPKNSVLIQDEFEDARWGWETMNDASGSLISYAGGGLRILVNQANFDYWTRIRETLGDARIEVDAIKLGGADDNSFGILCRYKDQANTYRFIASSDGYVGIAKIRSGKLILIHASQMSFSSAVNRGSAVNRLRADCVGQDLSFYVNGQLAAQARDADLASGEVGLMAGANTAPVVDILFDHFVVIQP